MQSVTPQEVLQAINKEFDSSRTIKCIASLENNWYNVTFDNEEDCEKIALQGMFLNDVMIQCERTSLQNSVVAHIKAPYEIDDRVIVNALFPYGTVANVRRQVHDFDQNIETGVRSVLIKNLKQPIPSSPSYLKVGGFSMPVRHRGQQKTCKICNKPGHFARDCELRGRCFICGNPNHRAGWHDRKQRDDDSETSTHVIYDDEEDVHERGSQVTDDDDVVPETDEETAPLGVENQNPKDDEVQAKKTTEEPKSKRTDNQDQVEDTTPDNQGRENRQTKEYRPSMLTEQKKEKTTTDKQKATKNANQARNNFNTKERSTKTKPSTYWDEAVKETRKRKAQEEDSEIDKERKVTKEGESDREYDMEQDDVPEDETSENETIENTNPEYVLYTRRGVQRSRKKRGTGAIATNQNTPSSSHPPSNSQPRGRGRGTRNT